MKILAIGDNMEIKEILLEIIKEASNGCVIIDQEEWPIAFNTKLYHQDQLILDYHQDSFLSELIIKDLNQLVLLIGEYIEKEKSIQRKAPVFCKNDLYNYIKLLISYLFVNATVTDFSNPIFYIEKVNSFLDDLTFDSFSEGVDVELSGIFDGNILNIKSSFQSVLMESPRKMEFVIKDKNDPSKTFLLPEISYGITSNQGEDVCYIYSILNKNNIYCSKYEKQISRMLYKMNKGVFEQESKEFKDYKNSDNFYYPENISDVSMSAVLSLQIFMSMLNVKNIKTIKAVPYLPLRYLSREQAANMSIKKEELRFRNQQIQRNVTDKFIRTFRRVSYHMEGLDILAYPYDVDEYLTLKLGKIHGNNNDLLERVDHDLIEGIHRNHY